MNNDQSQVNETEERVGARIFHEFRLKFSQLIEENAEMRLVLAAMGASVATTQARIEERLQEIATALRESVMAEKVIDDVSEKIRMLEQKLEGKEGLLGIIDSRLELFDANLKQDETRIGESGLIIRIIGILVILMTCFLVYHLMFGK